MIKDIKNKVLEIVGNFSGNMSINKKVMNINAKDSLIVTDTLVIIDGNVTHQHLQSNRLIIEEINITGVVTSVDSQCGDICINGDVKCDVQTQTGNIKVEGNVTGQCSTVCGNISKKG